MLEIQNIVTASDCHIIQVLQKHLLHWSFALKQSTSHEANEAIIHLTNAMHTHTRTCTRTRTHAQFPFNQRSFLEFFHAGPGSPKEKLWLMPLLSTNQQCKNTKGNSQDSFLPHPFLIHQLTPAESDRFTAPVHNYNNSVNTTPSHIQLTKMPKKI